MKKKESIGSVQKIFLILLSIATIVFISIYTYTSLNNRSVNNAMKEEGYTNEKESIFYEKVETNNTIEDYNKDVKENKNSEFIKYYVNKDFNSFVELKMKYADGVSTTLNINANLKNNEINYNYELSYKDTYLILEGNTDNNYECHRVVDENISNETIEKHCEYIQGEIKQFIDKRNEFVSKSEINKRIN